MKRKIFLCLLLVLLVSLPLSASEVLNETKSTKLDKKEMVQQLMHAEEINEIGKSIDIYTNELFGVLNVLADEDTFQKGLVRELSVISKGVVATARNYYLGAKMSQWKESNNDFHYFNTLHFEAISRVKFYYEYIKWLGNNLENKSSIYYIDKIKQGIRELNDLLGENTKTLAFFTKN